MLAALGGGALDAFLGAREARRGGGLGEARDVDIGAARLGVRMLRGLLHGEHGREADVGALHDRAPFVARLGLEDAVELALELRPRLAVHLRRQALALQAGLLEQQLVELRLDRSERDELAVLGLVGAVEMRAAIEHVGPALVVVPQAGARHAVDAAQQQRRAVDHRGVDHLALARLLRLEQAAHHAEGQQHAAAAEIADQVERRDRLVLAADGMQRAGERDVVDVVAGRLGERAFLAPAGHAAIDQLGIAREADVGPEAQPLGDAGAERLGHAVGLLDQAQHDLDAFLLLQVDRDRAAAAVVDGEFRLGQAVHDMRPGAVDADHVGAHVAQHHRAHRARADARQFDDRQSRKRTCHGFPPAKCIV